MSVWRWFRMKEARKRAIFYMMYSKQYSAQNTSPINLSLILQSRFITTCDMLRDVDVSVYKTLSECYATNSNLSQANSNRLRKIYTTHKDNTQKHGLYACARVWVNDRKNKWIASLSSYLSPSPAVRNLFSSWRPGERGVHLGEIALISSASFIISWNRRAGSVSYRYTNTIWLPLSQTLPPCLVATRWTAPASLGPREMKTAVALLLRTG